ncbi:amino acid/polyamine transporter I [Xylaria bambusicola]|uniref:amino acid/polyamine transporter I n=1 Tax=Xylaria bambusicola TaxID=326684 RepID=UPI002008D44A|nr:amino acid/polyamine transporter I [Xylaria bambusicola]KAI0525653.1 amino acid/polyamine transporter I [Xylaria bambusicola]
MLYPCFPMKPCTTMGLARIATSKWESSKNRENISTALLVHASFRSHMSLVPAGELAVPHWLFHSSLLAQIADIVASQTIGCVTDHSAGMSGTNTPSYGPQRRETDEQPSAHAPLIPRSENSDELRLPRKGATLTQIDCLALIVSLQIGSGIFSAPSLVAQQVRSPGEALGIFVVAGLLVWTGAASFVELGLLVPSNGGIQDYLRASWGEYSGYLFSWIWVGIVRPGGNAVIATIFADFFLKALQPSDPIWPWATKIAALGCVALLTAINCLGATAGAKAANVFMVLKFAALGSIVAIGFTNYVLGYGYGVPSSDTGWFGQDPVTDVWGSLGSLSTAVFAALFCYGGWESAGFIAGDMKNPGKDLPLAIHWAMALVITGFFLMNASLYVCLPFEVIRDSKTVAVEFANRTIGAWGGLIFTIVVAISAMGAVNANLFAVAKLCVAASQRAYFPPILANLHCCAARDEEAYFRRALSWPFRPPVLLFVRLTRRLRWEHSVPVLALLLNAMLTSLFILVGSFTGLLTMIEMLKFFCYMMSVIGLIIMRRRADEQMPNLSHPTYRTYRTWVGNPIIFASVSGVLIIRGALSAPLRAPVILSMGILVLAVFYRSYNSQSCRVPRHT